MATYIMLMDWTEQGLKNVGQWSQRVSDARRQIEAAGGRLSSVYLTMGAHDVVATIDGIDDTAMAKLAIGIGKLGNARTTTLRAFPEAEAVQLTQGS